MFTVELFRSQNMRAILKGYLICEELKEYFYKCLRTQYIKSSLPRLEMVDGIPALLEPPS